MKYIRKNSFWIPTFLLLSITIFTIFYLPIDITSVSPTKGAISLKQWNNKSIIKLNGEWAYYEDAMIEDIRQTSPTQYVKMPHFFKQNKQYDNEPYGVATYKLRITDLHPNIFYGIQIINESSAYRLTVNNQDLLKAGTVGDSYNTHKPEMKAQIGYFQPNDQGIADIAIEISNFSYNYGGLWKEIKIGAEEQIAAYYSHQNNVEILLFASILILGLFFLALYSVNIEFKSLLFFSMICLIIALRILLTNNRQFYNFIYPISWDTGTRLEFLTGYVLLPCFILFLYSLNFINKHKFINWLLYLFIIASIIITTFTSNPIYANLLKPFMNLCVLSIPYIAYIIIQGIRKQQSGSLLVLIGSLGFVISALMDFYAHLDYYLLPFGTFFMLIFFSIVVTKNFFKLKQQHDYLEDAIMKDALTGLKNRLFLDTLIARGLPVANAYKYYVFFFDLDKFKLINDTYGHHVGDAILIESAKRIRESFRESDDIICRYGGDEFIAISEVKEQDYSSQQIVNSILQRFEEPFMIDGKQYSLHTSIGVSEYRRHDDLQKIIKLSDKAMYEAKRTTKNNFHSFN